MKKSAPIMPCLFLCLLFTDVKTEFQSCYTLLKADTQFLTGFHHSLYYPLFYPLSNSILFSVLVLACTDFLISSSSLYSKIDTAVTSALCFDRKSAGIIYLNSSTILVAILSLNLTSYSTTSIVGWNFRIKFSICILEKTSI